MDAFRLKLLLVGLFAHVEKDNCKVHSLLGMRSGEIAYTLCFFNSDGLQVSRASAP